MYFQMLVRSYIIIGLTATILTVRAQLSTNNIGELLLEYESYIDASISLDKTDRELMSTWSMEFHLKQVNITSHYRLEMTRHKDHSFRGKKTNPKWKNCVSLREVDISRLKTSYFDGETACLKNANSADKDKVQVVHQVEREIRKWRKSYRYLSSLCNSNNPDDRDAANCCLVEYVKRDDYDVVFQRLLIMKLEAMDSLLLQLNEALSGLEHCLKECLARFLNELRNILDASHKCYNKNNKE